MDGYGLDEDWFNGFNEAYFEISVKLNSGNTLKCGTYWGCKVRASWDYTPIWYGTVPSVTYPGQKVTMIINPARAPTLQFSRNTFLHMIDVKFDDVELDMRKYIDEEVAKQKTL